MSRQQSYSDDFIASALALVSTNKGNVSGTARELGIPESTLRHWVKDGIRANNAIMKSEEEKKQSFQSLFESVARRALGHITEEKMQKMSGKDLIMMAAIAYDKAGGSSEGDDTIQAFLEAIRGKPRAYRPDAVA